MTDVTLILALIFVIWFISVLIDLLAYRYEHQQFPNKKQFIDKVLDSLMLSAVFVFLGYLFSTIFR